VGRKAEKLDTKLTELIQEALARDLVRKIQEERKAWLDIKPESECSD
jgi:hypothetical protein